MELLDVVDLHLAEAPVNAASASGNRLPVPLWGERSHRTLAVFAGIMLLAAGLRFALADYSLWFDEYASLFFADQPYARLWSGWMVRETNPPLFYSILRGWIELVGPGDRILLRVPTILASMLTIAVAYFALARLYGVRAALLGALLLTVSAQQIAYAHQVRGYSFLTLALSISFFSLMRIAAAGERGEREPVLAWLGYVAGALAAIYLHDTAVLWVPVATLALMMVDRRFIPFVGRDWLWLAAADLAIAIGAAWAVYIIYQQTKTVNANISWLQFPGVLGSAKLYWTSTLLARNPRGIQAICAGAVLAAAVFGIVRTYRRKETQFATLCWVGAAGLFFAVSLKHPVLVERTLVWMGIFPATLAAAGATTLRGSRTFFILAASLMAAGLVNLVAVRNSFSVENWDGAIARVLEDPKAVLVVSGEGGAVAAGEACKFADRRDHCRIPIIALSGQTSNAWAKGYAQKIPATPDGRLALSSAMNLYTIQRFDEQLIRDLRAAGLRVEVRNSRAFFAGPFGPPLLADLKSIGCARNTVLDLACPAQAGR